MRNIVVLLSGDFMKLVLIAFIVAVPLGYFPVSHWLQNFAYRVEIGPMIFLVAGVTAALIAALTVFYQALRAATANPAEVLRNE